MFDETHVGYMIGDQIRVDATPRFNCEIILQGYQGEIILYFSCLIGLGLPQNFQNFEVLLMMAGI